MNLINDFENPIELTNGNWFDILTLNSKFTLLGLKINDSENLINKNYKSSTYNNTE